MSASREKNKRKEQAAVPETSNEAKKGMSKGLKTTLTADQRFLRLARHCGNCRQPQAYPGYGQLLL